MKITLAIFIFISAISQIFAQSDLNKMVETEKAFAKMAAEKNTRAAFLEFSADDGIQFNPNPVNS
ncbi:MAG TPA: hypothetical protein PKY82_32015, partial [Pyrinomonadaceae bacterium]|nr:hypothetical protein [Pyrinomonadaceae bacterium]